MPVFGRLRPAFAWLRARRLAPRIAAAEAEIKAGRLAEGIEALHDILQGLEDRATRSAVVRRIAGARLRLAARLRKRNREVRAARQFSAVVKLVATEISGERLTGARSMSLLGKTLGELSRQGQLPWIAGLRGGRPVVNPVKVTVVQRLEAIACRSSGQGPDDAGMAGQPPGDVDEVLHLVRRLAPKNLPAVWWLAIHDRLYRQGLVAGAIAAKQAAARSVLSADADGRPTALHLAASLCLDDRERVEAILACLDAPVLERDGWLALGEVGRAREIHAACASAADRRFSAWLAGRSVAVVGPARNALGNGAAIDAHDRVVRTNLVAGEAFRASGPMIGSRADAIYYNSIFIEKKAAGIIETLKAVRPAYAMLRTPMERFAVVRRLPFQRSRSYYFTPAIFMARGYAMRHILNDLALAGAGHVTVYGADFFLGGETHFTGYFDRKKAFDHAASYVVHDPLDCWRFLRRLKLAGVIAADAVLDPILSMPEKSFVAALQRRIGGDAVSPRKGGKTAPPA